MKTQLILTIRVQYETNGESISDLKKLLEYSAKHLANEGLLTGETSAEVNAWSYGVAQIKGE